MVDGRCPASGYLAVVWPVGCTAADTVGVGLVWHGYLPAVRPTGRTTDMVGYIRRYAVAHKTCNR